MTVRTLCGFIKENRSEIDLVINQVTYRHDGNDGSGRIPEPAPRYNDEERRQWVLNDETLYNWARSKGVQI